MFEHRLSLPLGRAREIDTDVHPPWSAQRGIKPLNVIGCDEKEPVGKEGDELTKLRV